MLEKLRHTGRGQWLDQEMERLGDPASYLNIPDLAWLRIRAPSRKPEVLGRLKALAAWREREAQGKNLPRGRIVKDETLADIAGHPPKSQADLARIRGLSTSWAQNEIGARMMAAIESSVPLPESEMPPREDRKPGLKVRSRDADVAPKLIARSDELEALAAGVRQGLSMLDGWRYDVFGKDALALVEGRMAFSVQSGKMVMSELPGD